jgi:hypothetical protein
MREYNPSQTEIRQACVLILRNRGTDKRGFPRQHQAVKRTEKTHGLREYVVSDTPEGPVFSLLDR